MTVIVSDNGFAEDDWTIGFCGQGAANDCRALDVAADVDPAMIALAPALKMIRVDFPTSADGRGFSIARTLRLRGYAGRLRARGHVLADQYAMARRSGFDEIEIDDALAARQPVEQWQFRARWQQNDYQSGLRGLATAFAD